MSMRCNEQQGGLYISFIGQDAFSVVLQDEIHCASPPHYGTVLVGTKPDKGGLSQLAAIWSLDKWSSGGGSLFKLSTPGENFCLFLRDQPALVSGSKHLPLLVLVQQVLPRSNNLPRLSRERTQLHMRRKKKCVCEHV